MKSLTKLFGILIVIEFVCAEPARANIADLYGGIGAGGSGLNHGAVITIDTNTWAGTLLSDPTGDVFGNGISGLALDNSSTLFATTTDSPNQLLTLDAMTGATLNSVNITLGGNNLKISDLANSPITNLLYGTGAGADGGSLYTINKLTGAALLIGVTESGIKAAIAFDAAGRLWETNDVDEVVQIDPLTAMRIGTGTALTDFYNGFTILQDGRFLGVLGDDQTGGIWQIDPTTGMEALLGNSNINTLGDLASRFTPATNGQVPESGATLGLLAFGVGGLMTLRHRRKT